MQAKRHLRAARISATVAALTLAGWGSSAAQEPIEFKAGISDPVNTVLAWYMARDAGLYAAHGLKVDIINMNGGSRGAAELQAGRLDVMHVGLSSVIRINRSGSLRRASTRRRCLPSRPRSLMLLGTRNAFSTRR